jgi:hypothetical protein
MEMAQEALEEIHPVPLSLPAPAPVALTLLIAEMMILHRYHNQYKQTIVNLICYLVLTSTTMTLEHGKKQKIDLLHKFKGDPKNKTEFYRQRI